MNVKMVKKMNKKEKMLMDLRLGLVVCEKFDPTERTMHRIIRELEYDDRMSFDVLINGRFCTINQSYECKVKLFYHESENKKMGIKLNKFQLPYDEDISEGNGLIIKDMGGIYNTKFDQLIKVLSFKNIPCPGKGAYEIALLAKPLDGESKFKKINSYYFVVT